LIIPKYQPTKPTLDKEVATADEEEEEGEEEQKDEENKDKEFSYCLDFLRKCGNPVKGLECTVL